MKRLDINQIRKQFLDFFLEKDHLVIDSFSLIPEDDDSLLLINAGMAPLKKYFTGEKKMAKDRVASSQRCVRTLDIDNVGKTTRHATFFEMLGNFSFGDYFKKEAISFAWEFLHERLEIPAEKLWISVYIEDDEAYDIWVNEMGIPENKVVRLGKEDNFWELEEGPCGPCSEIFYDHGVESGCGRDDCDPSCDCGRFIEVWNLVFTQFNKDKEGNYHPLEHPNIDTGMGLERIAMVLQEADSIYDISSMDDILSAIALLTETKYKASEEAAVSYRIIGDHAKAMMFLVYDGVIPSNEGRGYILRRLIRRAARHGKLIGINKAFLNKVVDKAIDVYKIGYPELEESRERIHHIIELEESKFQETIDKGLGILNTYIEEAKGKGADQVDADAVFKLYDTYGFPLDLTIEILEENKLSVDLKEFDQFMQEQKERSRSARHDDNIGWSGNEIEKVQEIGETKFLGYEELVSSSKTTYLFRDSEEVKSLAKGDHGLVFTEKSPFYGESGGQVGDQGLIRSGRARLKVVDTQKNKNNGIIHYVEVLEGVLHVGDEVVLEVDPQIRRDTIKNHTATHLLHQALRDVLGNHINQAGSLVTPDRLRFDITHFEAISNEDLMKVQDIVNEKISLGLPVDAREMSLKESQELGAVGLFEDKYQDIVRVLTIGDYSIELCGGTHVGTTSDIQMFKIMHETSVAAGIRRIEAITGRACYRELKASDQLIHELQQSLKVQGHNDLLPRIHSMIEEIKQLNIEIKSVKQQDANSSLDKILSEVEDVEGIKLARYIFHDVDMDTLRNLADQLKQRLGSGVIVLASISDDKVHFVASVTENVIDLGVQAGNLVREVAKITGGNGGGRKDFAAAGGKDKNKVSLAIQETPRLIKEFL